MPPNAGGEGNDDHLVEMRVPGHDGRRLFFDEIREVRLREMPAKGPDCRRREDDVANHPQANQQNPQWDYGSMVASSSSITGMSSFTG